MNAGTVHVIGAGLSGLAASVALAKRGANVRLIEGAGQAGGRCRSYFDPVLNHQIDNGNHIVLTGNRATQDYLRTIGAADTLVGPDYARFAFVDIRTGERWAAAPNNGIFPWWVLSRERRVPGSSLGDYLALGKLLMPGRGKRIADVIACEGPVWDKLLQPILLATLNTDPANGSAALAANVIRETLVKGGRAYQPRMAKTTVAASFVDPALAFLAKRNVEVRFGTRLRKIIFENVRIASLEFADGTIELPAEDRVVLATPPWVTQELVEGISAPNEFCSIVNAHFALAPPPHLEPMLGIFGGTAEWVFAFEDRLSVTISGADNVVDRDRETLAREIWGDVAAAHDLSPEIPPWQIVKERRATFAATPEQVARRAGTKTRWRNLFLAGDWTDTGLPGTIEGAVRSGQRAAKLAA